MTSSYRIVGSAIQTGLRLSISMLKAVAEICMRRDSVIFSAPASELRGH